MYIVSISGRARGAMLSASYNDRVIPGKDAQLNELLEEIPPCANVPGQEDEDCENRNRMHQVCASYPGWQGRAVEGNVLLPIDRRNLELQQASACGVYCGRGLRSTADVALLARQAHMGHSIRDYDFVGGSFSRKTRIL